jgi:hypothetical protein
VKFARIERANVLHAVYLEALCPYKVPREPPKRVSGFIRAVRA